jgi:hypothetical protein
MSERYVIPLRYDETLVCAAARGYVTRALFRENAALTFAPLALIALACAMLYVAGDGETAMELLVVSVIVLAIFVASGWRMHLRMLRGKVEAMRGRWPMARLYSNGRGSRRSGRSKAPGF